MNGTPDDQLAAIERRLARLETILEPVAALLTNLGPDRIGSLLGALERRLNNPAARWRAGRGAP